MYFPLYSQDFHIQIIWYKYLFNKKVKYFKRLVLANIKFASKVKGKVYGKVKEKVSDEAQGQVQWFIFWVPLSSANQFHT